MVMTSWLRSATVGGLLSRVQGGLGLSGLLTSRSYGSKDFWAKGTGITDRVPGHKWKTKRVFGNYHQFNLWLKNSGPKRASYVLVRKTKSFDALMKFELGRTRMMQRLVRGDKKIAEY